MKKPFQTQTLKFYEQRNKKAHDAAAKQIIVSREENTHHSRQASDEYNTKTKRSMHGFTHRGRNLSFGIYLLTERTPSYV